MAYCRLTLQLRVFEDACGVPTELEERRVALPASTTPGTRETQRLAALVIGSHRVHSSGRFPLTSYPCKRASAGMWVRAAACVDTCRQRVHSLHRLSELRGRPRQHVRRRFATDSLPI